MRLTFCYKKLDQYDAGLREIELLIEKDPKSAALHHIQGVLFGWNNKIDRALKSFDEAISLAPSWMEPQLERIEKTIMAGDYKSAITLTDTYLKPRTLTDREKLILKTNRIVASVLVEATYLETIPGQALQTEIRDIKINSRNREDWFVKPIWDYFNAINDPLTLPPTAKKKVFELLSNVHEKLMPDEDPLV